MQEWVTGPSDPGTPRTALTSTLSPELTFANCDQQEALPLAQSSLRAGSELGPTEWPCRGWGVECWWLWEAPVSLAVGWGLVWLQEVAVGWSEESMDLAVGQMCGPACSQVCPGRD